MLMIHDASGVCLGNAADMEEMAQLLALISDNIADAYASRAGGTREEWREAMRAESWYLPEDAVKAGLADEALAVPKKGEPVEEPKEDEPDMARAFDLAAYGYAGPKWAEPEPKPAQVTLTFNLGESIDEHVFESLREMVNRRDPAPEVAATPAEPGPVPDEPAEESAAGPEAHAEPLAEPEAVAPAAEPVDEWAALTAHLTKDDAWSALVSNLIEPDASSSAATAA